MADAGYPVSQAFTSEIIAWGAPTADAAMLLWLNSPPHWAELNDGRYRAAGLGVACGGAFPCVWVVTFGSLVDQTYGGARIPHDVPRSVRVSVDRCGADSGVGHRLHEHRTDRLGHELGEGPAARNLEPAGRTEHARHTRLARDEPSGRADDDVGRSGTTSLVPRSAPSAKRARHVPALR
jgi:hypothetical protein